LCFASDLPLGVKNLFVGAAQTIANTTDIASYGPAAICGVGYDVYVHYDPLGTGGALANTVKSFSGAYIHHSTVTVNASRYNDVWWSTSVQSCTVLSTSSQWQGGIDCKADGVALALHELAHAIGMRHSTESGNCATGYTYTFTSTACVTVAKFAVMFWNGGDGYRRTLTTDDKAGINWLY
jgi:hypothetical protein